MTQRLLFEVCLQNLQRQLEVLLDSAESTTQNSLQNALAYTTELEKYASTFIGGTAEKIEAPPTGDSTNYKLFELLASFGLTEKQLLLVAKNEALHELRKLRMLRIVYG